MENNEDLKETADTELRIEEKKISLDIEALNTESNKLHSNISLEKDFIMNAIKMNQIEEGDEEKEIKSEKDTLEVAFYQRKKASEEKEIEFSIIKEEESDKFVEDAMISNKMNQRKKNIAKLSNILENNEGLSTNKAASPPFLNTNNDETRLSPNHKRMLTKKPRFSIANSKLAEMSKLALLSLGKDNSTNNLEKGGEKEDKKEKKSKSNRPKTTRITKTLNLKDDVKYVDDELKVVNHSSFSLANFWRFLTNDINTSLFFKSLIFFEILLFLFMLILMLLGSLTFNRLNLISLPYLIFAIFAFPWILMHHSSINPMFKSATLNGIMFYSGAMCLGHLIVELAAKYSSLGDELAVGCLLYSSTYNSTTFHANRILCIVGFQSYNGDNAYFIYDVLIFVYGAFLRCLFHIVVSRKGQQPTDKLDQKVTPVDLSPIMASPNGKRKPTKNVVIEDVDEKRKFMKTIRHQFQIRSLPIFVMISSCIDSSVFTIPLLFVVYITVILWSRRKISFGKQRFFRRVVCAITFLHICTFYIYQIAAVPKVESTYFGVTKGFQFTFQYIQITFVVLSFMFSSLIVLRDDLHFYKFGKHYREEDGAALKVKISSAQEMELIMLNVSKSPKSGDDFTSPKLLRGINKKTFSFGANAENKMDVIDESVENELNDKKREKLKENELPEEENKDSSNNNYKMAKVLVNNENIKEDKANNAGAIETFSNGIQKELQLFYRRAILAAFDFVEKTRLTFHVLMHQYGSQLALLLCMILSLEGSILSLVFLIFTFMGYISIYFFEKGLFAILITAVCIMLSRASYSSIVLLFQNWQLPLILNDIGLKSFQPGDEGQIFQLYVGTFVIMLLAGVRRYKENNEVAQHLKLSSRFENARKQFQLYLAENGLLHASFILTFFTTIDVFDYWHFPFIIFLAVFMIFPSLAKTLWIFLLFYIEVVMLVIYITQFSFIRESELKNEATSSLNNYDFAKALALPLATLFVAHAEIKLISKAGGGIYNKLFKSNATVTKIDSAEKLESTKVSSEGDQNTFWLFQKHMLPVFRFCIFVSLLVEVYIYSFFLGPTIIGLFYCLIICLWGIINIFSFNTPKNNMACMHILCYLMHFLSSGIFMLQFIFLINQDEIMKILPFGLSVEILGLYNLGNYNPVIAFGVHFCVMVSSSSFVSLSSNSDKEINNDTWLSFLIWRNYLELIIERGLSILVFALAVLIGDTSLLSLLYCSLSIIRMIISSRFSYIFTKIILLVSCLSLSFRYYMQFSSCITLPSYFGSVNLDEIKVSGFLNLNCSSTTKSTNLNASTLYMNSPWMYATVTDLCIFCICLLDIFCIHWQLNRQIVEKIIKEESEKVSKIFNKPLKFQTKETVRMLSFINNDPEFLENLKKEISEASSSKLFEDKSTLTFTNVVCFFFTSFFYIFKRTSDFIVPLSLLIASYIHAQTIMGIVYFAILVIILNLNRQKLEKGWVLILIIVALLVIIQLVFILIGTLESLFPLISNFEKNKGFFYWLGVLIPNRAVLLADVISLSLITNEYLEIKKGIVSDGRDCIASVTLKDKTQAVRLYVMNLIRLNLPTHIAEHRKSSLGNNLTTTLDMSYLASVVQKKLEDVSKKKEMLFSPNNAKFSSNKRRSRSVIIRESLAEIGNVFDYTDPKSQSIRAHFLWALYFLFPYVVLFLIFCAGSIYFNIASIGYIYFPLRLLGTDNSKMLRGRRKVWTQFWYYNTILFAVRLLFQIPYFQLSNEVYSVQVLLGLTKIIDPTTNLQTGNKQISVDFQVFILLQSLHALFQTSSFGVLLARLDMEDEIASTNSELVITSLTDTYEAKIRSLKINKKKMKNRLREVEKQRLKEYQAFDSDEDDNKEKNATNENSNGDGSKLNNKLLELQNIALKLKQKGDETDSSSEDSEKEDGGGRISLASSSKASFANLKAADIPLNNGNDTPDKENQAIIEKAFVNVQSAANNFFSTIAIGLSEAPLDYVNTYANEKALDNMNHRKINLAPMNKGNKGKRKKDIENFLGKNDVDTSPKKLGCWSLFMGFWSTFRTYIQIICLLLYRYFLQHTLHLSFLSMIIFYCADPSFLTMIYPLFVFGFGLLTNPRNLPPIILPKTKIDEMRDGLASSPNSFSTKKLSIPSSPDEKKSNGTVDIPSLKETKSTIGNLKNEYSSSSAPNLLRSNTLTEETYSSTSKVNEMKSGRFHTMSSVEVIEPSRKDSSKIINSRNVLSPNKVSSRVLLSKTKISNKKNRPNKPSLTIDISSPRTLTPKTSPYTKNRKMSVNPGTVPLASPGRLSVEGRKRVSTDELVEKEEEEAFESGNLIFLHPVVQNPPRKYWAFLIFYTLIIICLKYLYNLPIVCDNYVDGHILLAPYCYNDTAIALLTKECLTSGTTANSGVDKSISPLCIPSYSEDYFRLSKAVNVADLPSYFLFINLCKGDLIILFFIMLHIWTLRQNGFFRWARFSKENTEQLYVATVPEAATLTKNEIIQLRRCFVSFDHEENGWVKTTDFVYAMVNLGYTPSKTDVQTMVSEIDVNQDGKLDFNEFVSAMSPMIAAARLGRDFDELDERRLIAAFEDKADEQGTVDVEEAIKVVLILDEKVDEKLIRDFFTNGDLELTANNRVSWPALEERIHTVFFPRYTDSIRLTPLQYENMFDIFNHLVHEISQETVFLSRDQIPIMLQKVSFIDPRFSFRNGLLQRKLREKIKGDAFTFKAVLKILDCKWDEENNGSGCCARLTCFATFNKIIFSFYVKFRNFIKRFFEFFYYIYFEYKVILFPIKPKPGADFYLYQLTIKLITFIVVAIFSSYSSIGSDYLSGSYILAIGYQFFILVMDRIFYLCRATNLKTLFHFFVLGVMFYNDISQSFHSFNTNYDYCIYALNCLYLFFSSIQISYGYSELVQSEVMTRYVHWFAGYVYLVVLVIPFLYELKVVLDWTCTSTTLYIYEWLQLEDINIDLYMTACGFHFVSSEGRKKGQVQPLYRKFLVGVLTFLGLIIVIWIPLLLFSSINPTNTSNPVLSTSLSIELNAYPAIFQTQQLVDGGALLPSVSPGLCSKEAPNSWQCVKSLLPFLTNITSSQDTEFSNEVQVVKIPISSNTNWEISPLTRLSLLSLLASNATANLNVLYIFSRMHDNVNPRISFSKSLTGEERHEMLNVLFNRLTGQSVLFKALVPPMLHINSDDSIVSLPAQGFPGWLDCNMTLFSPPSQPEYFTFECGNDIYNNATTLYTISSQYIEIAALFSATSILAFYVGVIYTIGRFVRLYFFGLRYELMYCSMAVTSKLRQICKDLYLARMIKDLELEEELYRNLVDIYRRPEILYKYSGPFQHWFPNKKIRDIGTSKN